MKDGIFEEKSKVKVTTVVVDARAELIVTAQRATGISCHDPSFWGCITVNSIQILGHSVRMRTSRVFQASKLRKGLSSCGTMYAMVSKPLTSDPSLPK